MSGERDDDRLPAGVELTPLDATFRADPYPTLRRLRERAPVHWDDALKRWVMFTW